MHDRLDGRPPPPPPVAKKKEMHDCETIDEKDQKLTIKKSNSLSLKTLKRLWNRQFTSHT